jgi:hypothetical protein
MYAKHVEIIVNGHEKASYKVLKKLEKIMFTYRDFLKKKYLISIKYVSHFMDH